MRGRADLPDGAGQEVGLQPRHHQALGEEGGQDAAQDLQEDRVQRLQVLHTRVGHPHTNTGVISRPHIHHSIFHIISIRFIRFIFFLNACLCLDSMVFTY